MSDRLNEFKVAESVSSRGRAGFPQPRRTRCTTILATALVLMLGTRGWAQFGDLRSDLYFPERPALIQRSAPIENLLKRAEEGITRSDWKLAIDSLQRVVDDEGGGLLLSGEHVLSGQGGQEKVRYYESIRARAKAMLASMPADGISAYRVLHGGRARAMYEEAIASGDEKLLQQVAERFPLSSVGDDAAERLAAWQLDRGNPSQALDILRYIESFCAGHDIPAWRIAMDRAAAWAMLGEREQALASLDAIGDPENIAPDVQQRLAALRRAIADDELVLPSHEYEPDGHTWPVYGGDPSRRNRMEAIHPELRENLPWRYTLPTDDPDWWETHFLKDRLEYAGAPAAMPVVSGDRLFVKTLRQIVALDLDSLDPIWRSVPTAPTLPDHRIERRGQFFFPEPITEVYSERDRLLHDDLGSTLSCAFGKVYSIERQGLLGADAENANPLRQLLGGLTAAHTGSQLVAWDAATGEPVWSRGRTGDAADELGGVHFLSAPIPVGDELWVVYIHDRDLFLGALAPDDGRLLRRLLLCSADETQVQDRYHEALYPAYDGYTLYVPTGLGLVIAVDTASFTLRWATQYERDLSRVARGNLEPQQWRCGVPAVTTNTVIIAPTDARHLMALDRASGEVQWMADRGQWFRYIIGCDASRVWIGGKWVACFAADTGQRLWGPAPTGTFNVTGRSVLSGSTIFVPMVDGLVWLDADTGDQLRLEENPPDQLALGNLLCVSGALISVDTNEVRKFPDLTTWYPKQLARYEADPTDTPTAIRLAWMEILRGDPDRAYDILDRIEDTPGRPDKRSGEIARLRVDALLALADRPGIDLNRAVEYMMDAVKMAETGRDKMRATMAYAATQRDLGRASDAYMALWRLGLSPAVDGYLTVAPKLRNKSRLVINEVLSRFERDLTALQLREIANETRAVLADAAGQLEDTATQAEARQELEHIAEMDDAGGAGQAALVILGRAARRAVGLERSEQYLLEAIRRNRVSTVTALAMRDLAEQYLGERQGCHLEASRLLDKLASEYAAKQIPSGGETLLVDAFASDSLVSDEVARLRKRVEPGIVIRHAFVDRPGRFKLVGSAPHAVGRAAALFNYVPDQPEAAMDLLMVADSARSVQALSVADDSLVWASTLGLVETYAQVLAEQISGEQNGLSSDARAFCDGQIAVVNGFDGVFGVGLLSGRRLWGIPYEDQDTAGRLALRNRLVAVDAGRLVCSPRRGVLVASRVADANDVLWERILGSNRVDTVFIRDEFCLTVDTRWQRASAYALEDGRLLSTTGFVQPALDPEPIPLSYVDGFLIGPDGANALVCYSVATGQRVWRIETEDELSWIFKPGDGFVGAALEGGVVLLVDVLKGESVLRVLAPEAEEGEIEGVLYDDSLILMPIVRSAGGRESPSLVCFDLASGRIRWLHANFGPTGASRFAYWRLLRASEDVIPIFFRAENAESNPFYRELGRLGLEVIDKSTGRIITPVVETNVPLSTDGRLTGDFVISCDRLLAATGKWMLSFPIISAGGSMDRSGRP